MLPTLLCSFISPFFLSVWNTCWITADRLQLITALYQRSLTNHLDLLVIHCHAIAHHVHAHVPMHTDCLLDCHLCFSDSVLGCQLYHLRSGPESHSELFFVCCSRLELQPSRTSPLAGSLELHTPIDWCCFVHCWVVCCAVLCLCCGFSNHRVTFLFGRRHLFSLRPVRPLVCILRSLVVSVSSTRSIHSLNPISRD